MKIEFDTNEILESLRSVLIRITAKGQYVATATDATNNDYDYYVGKNPHDALLALDYHLERLRRASKRSD